MSKIIKHHYVLAVPDAEITSKFFIDILGFCLAPMEDKGWRFVQKDKLMVMIGSCPDAILPSKLGDHSYFAYWEVTDVDAYYREIISAGGSLRGEPVDKPWGMREFLVVTPDGHRIMIGQSI